MPVKREADAGEAVVDTAALVRLAASPWPRAGEPSLAQGPDGALRVLAHAPHMLALPDRSQLVDVAPWPAVPWPHPPPPTEPARRRVPADEPLRVDVRAGDARAPTPLPVHGACAVADPSALGRTVHLLDCGAHVYDLAWAPQAGGGPEWLVAACAARRAAESAHDSEAESPGALQLWQVGPEDHVRLAAVLEHAAGTPVRVAWAPGGASHALGALAVAYADGTVRLLEVPFPDTLPAARVRLTERACLQVPGTTCQSIAWGALLAVGCADGRVAVYDPLQKPSPLAVHPLHDSLVSALSWQQLPPHSAAGDAAAGDAAAGSPPTTLLSLGFDGTELVTEVVSGASVRLAHGREPRYAAAWSPWSRAWVVDLGDQHYGVTYAGDAAHQHHTLGFHHGRVLSIAASRFHPFVATGSADGSVKLTNALGVGKRKAADQGARVMHKRFRLAPEGDALVMLHGFYPEGFWPARGAGAAPTPRLDDRFDPRVAVRAVAWSPNLGRGLLLASGTAVGLVRVEWAEAGDDAPPAS